MLRPEVLKQQSLDPRHRFPTILGDHGGQPHGLLAELIAGDQVIEKADTMGLLRLHDAAGEEQLLGDGPTDLVRQGPRAVDPTVGRGQKPKAGMLTPDP